MIKSGGSFIFSGFRCVIGAVISIKGRFYIVSASHIFRNSRAGNRVHVDDVEGIVMRFLEDFDVALIAFPSGCEAEVTPLGSAAVMEEAHLANEKHTIACKVIRAGTSLHSLLFPCFNMPEPGDSGSPVLQRGKVIGLLSSVMLSNCTGTAVSSDVLKSLTV